MTGQYVARMERSAIREAASTKGPGFRFAPSGLRRSICKSDTTCIRPSWNSARGEFRRWRLRDRAVRSPDGAKRNPGGRVNEGPRISLRSIRATALIFPPPSLRGAKRRSNPAFRLPRNGLLRFARNDGAGDLPVRLFSATRVKPHIEKYFCLYRNKNHPIFLPVPSHQGALANVINAGRDAVDADGALGRGLDADGEVVWSWRLDAGVKSGGSQFRRRRRQTSPISGESTKETVKTIRVRECRVVPVYPW